MLNRVKHLIARITTVAALTPDSSLRLRMT